MSKFRVRCSACGKVLQVPESARGKKASCTCGHQFRLPAAKAASSPPKRKRRPPQPVVHEDLEEVDEPLGLDDLELLDDDVGQDEFDEFDEYDDAPVAPPPRRKKKPSGSRRRSSGKSEGKKKSIWDFFSGKNAVLAALDEHEQETGESYELIKVGIPPLRLWLSNRKGDRWGLVADRKGNEFWVRYRIRLFSGGSPLTFYD